MFYVGDCSVCGQGTLGVRTCGQCNKGCILCDECDALWRTPNLKEAPQFPTQPMVSCPNCMHSLNDESSHWSTKEEIVEYGWMSAVVGEGATLGEEPQQGDPTKTAVDLIAGIDQQSEDVIAGTTSAPAKKMRILITAGPTREYLDDVRYLSNASSGRMGYALAESAIAAGHEVVLVTGPVDIPVPRGCDCRHVETTEEMREACVATFSDCDGVIAAAAVCDYKPKNRITGKIAKTGEPITIDMIQTDDVLAELGHQKGDRWVMGFALEAVNPRENALQKLRAKNCDWIILNRPTAIGSDTNQVELIDPTGQTVEQYSGSKRTVANSLIGWIETQVARS